MVVDSPLGGSWPQKALPFFYPVRILVLSNLAACLHVGLISFATLYGLNAISVATLYGLNAISVATLYGLNEIGVATLYGLNEIGTVHRA